MTKITLISRFMLAKSASACSFFALLLLLIACDSSKEKSSDSNLLNSDGQVFGDVTVVEIAEADPGCKSDNCSNVQLSYPVFSKNEQLSTSIKQMMSKQIGFYTRSTKSADLNEIIENIFFDYQEFLADFPESQTPWTIGITYQPLLISAKHICLQIREESYTGGAHPTDMRYLIHMDKSGRVKDQIEWIADLNALTSIAEKEFRSVKKLAENESLSEAGFLFENNQFALPENIGLTATHMVLYYNAYEIGSYADGPFELSLPLSAVIDLLQVN